MDLKHLFARPALSAPSERLSRMESIVPIKINHRLLKIEKVMGKRRDPKVIQIVFPRLDGSGTYMKGPTMTFPALGPVHSNWNEPESWPDYEELKKWDLPKYN